MKKSTLLLIKNVSHVRMHIIYIFQAFWIILYGRKKVFITLINKLIESIPNRIKAVTNTKGFPTLYIKFFY